MENKLIPKIKKSKKITLCVSEYEYNLLTQIRANHGVSISQLVRDSITFFSAYYQRPNSV